MLRNQAARFEQSYWPVPLVFGAAVLASLLFWAILPSHLRVNELDDYRRFYEPVARHLLEGRWFRWPDGTPALLYAPGFPLILAGIFGLADLLHVSEDMLMSAVILLCTGLTAVFVYLLARTVWRVLPALVAALVWISYPFALWFTKQPNSETPFLLFFYAGMYLFCYAWLRKNHSGSFYFLSGLFIGIAMLIRPVVIAWGLVLWGPSLVHQSRYGSTFPFVPDHHDATWQCCRGIALGGVGLFRYGESYADHLWRTWTYNLRFDVWQSCPVPARR
jgi:hypothetical protein